MIFTGTFIPVSFTIYFCIKRYQELQEDKSQDIYNETRRNVDIESHELQPNYVSDIYAQGRRNQGPIGQPVSSEAANVIRQSVTDGSHLINESHFANEIANIGSREDSNMTRALITNQTISSPVVTNEISNNQRPELLRLPSYNTARGLNDSQAQETPLTPPPKYDEIDFNVVSEKWGNLQTSKD